MTRSFWSWICLFHDIGYKYEELSDQYCSYKNINDLIYALHIKKNLLDESENRELIKKYYEKRILGKKACLDHGIVGALLLYDALMSLSESTEIYSSIVQYKAFYVKICDTIALHNMWRATPESVNEYSEHGLQELIPDMDQHHMIFYKDNPVVRSAEHISKSFYDHCLTTTERRRYWKIACFSERNDSIPMWAYYAANHTGLCLKYDFNLLNQKELYNRSIIQSLHKVWYTNNRPVDPDGNFSYLVKAQDWSHEQEWRLLNWRDTDQISLPCMTEVYLGMNASLELFDDTVDAIKASGRDIRLFCCEPNSQEYRIDFQAINLST